MFEYSTVFGIDSHARTNTACALQPETGEVEFRRFEGCRPWDELAEWMSSFPRPSIGAYECV